MTPETDPDAPETVLMRTPEIRYQPKSEQRSICGEVLTILGIFNGGAVDVDSLDSIVTTTANGANRQTVTARARSSGECDVLVRLRQRFYRPSTCTDHSRSQS